MAPEKFKNSKVLIFNICQVECFDNEHTVLPGPLPLLPALPLLVNPAQVVPTCWLQGLRGRGAVQAPGKKHFPMSQIFKIKIIIPRVRPLPLQEYLHRRLPRMPPALVEAVVPVAVMLLLLLLLLLLLVPLVVIAAVLSRVPSRTVTYVRLGVPLRDPPGALGPVVAAGLMRDIKQIFKMLTFVSNQLHFLFKIIYLVLLSNFPLLLPLDCV